MDSLVVAGKKYEARTPFMASAIQHFRRLLGRGPTASATAPHSCSCGPIEAWDRVVRLEMAEGRTYAQAVSECVRRYPSAHKAMLTAFNAKHGRSL